MILEIPDATFKQYLTQAGGDMEKAHQLVQDCLKRFRGAYGGGRCILVTGEPLARLEAIYNTPTPNILSAEDLCERVEQAATIMVNGVRMEFTPTQMADLKHWAEKGGLTLEEAVRTTVEQMSYLFFDHLPEAVHNAAREEIVAPPPPPAPELPSFEEFLVNGVEEPDDDEPDPEDEPMDVGKSLGEELAGAAELTETLTAAVVPEPPPPQYAEPVPSAIPAGRRGTTVQLPLRPRRG